MRDSLITRPEFDQIYSRFFGERLYLYTSRFAKRNWCRHFGLAEIPHQVATAAYDEFERTTGVSLEADPRYDEELLFEVLEANHAAFLKSASESDMRRAFIRKALDSSESVDSDERWERNFGTQMANEFGVPVEVGQQSMRTAERIEGKHWTDTVIDHALALVEQHLQGSLKPSM